MSERLRRWRQKLIRIIGFLLSYGAAKGCAFATPLVLATLLTPTEYGALEFALTAGLLGATLLALGVPQAMPPVENERAYEPVKEPLQKGA